MTENQNSLTTPPEPLPTRPIKLPTAYETTLANGLRAVVVEDQRLPLISYRLSLRTGDAHNPPGFPGLMDMLTGLLTEGTESRTSREIADEVARLGATLQAGASSDYTTVAASSVSCSRTSIMNHLLWLSPTRTERLVRCPSFAAKSQSWLRSNPNRLYHQPKAPVR